MIPTLRRLVTSLALLCVTAVASPVFAQDDAGARGAQPGDASIYTEDDLREMSPQSRVSESAQALERMRSTLSSAAALLDSTRQQERDVLRLNCINSKLAAIKGFVKVAEQANLELQEAVRINNESRQLHNAKLIFLADARVQVLGDEAAACTGDSVQYTGPTRLITDVDDDIRDDNTVDVDISVDIPIERLPEVSPYQ